MPRKADEPDIFSVDRILGEVQSLVPDLAANGHAVRRLLERLDDCAGILAAPRYAGHQRHLQNLRSAVAKEDPRKAAMHLGALRRVVRPTSNDRPFREGDQVHVIRTPRGWTDGRLEARVKKRSQTPDGTYRYVVEDGDGIEHDVDHTRDLSPKL